jgi:hypothetical protein
MALSRATNRIIVTASAAVLAVVGCARPLVTQVTLPDAHTLVRDQLVIHSESPLPAHHRLLEELTARRAELCQLLKLPVSDEPIHVYMFDTPEKFEAFMRLRHPNFPQRRAFFLETDTRLEIYAQWGDRVAEDLRHEVTHGYLHSVVPCLPPWLDEGLAEYFETPRGRQGLNQEHINELSELLKSGKWRPDLARLDSLPPSADMTRADYAEAWAWVHFLLNGPPTRQDMLREYFRELRQNGTSRPLLASLRQLGGDPDADLIAHIQRLSAGPSAALANPSG